MRRIALILCLAAAPAWAQPSPPGSLPAPTPAAPATPREPGLGERAGAAIDRGLQSAGEAGARAARATGEAAQVAGERAGQWTGNALERLGEWTQRQGARLRGEPAPSAEPPPATAPLPPPVGSTPLPPTQRP